MNSVAASDAGNKVNQAIAIVTVIKLTSAIYFSPTALKMCLRWYSYTSNPLVSSILTSEAVIKNNNTTTTTNTFVFIIKNHLGTL